MGNCLGCRCVEDDSDIEQYYHSGYGSGGQGGATRPPPSGGSITHTIVGYTEVEWDLVQFEYTNEVPSKLGDYVSASKATQKDWYAKLLRAWRRANPPPTSVEAVAALIIKTLQGHDIGGLLRFYRLPCPAAPTIQHVPEVTKFKEEDDGPTWPPVLTFQNVFEVTESEEEEFEEEDDGPTWHPSLTLQDLSEVSESEDEDEEDDDGLAWPLGVRYEIHTLPVKEERVGDGDGFVVFVDVYKDARETANLPLEIKNAMKQRHIARNQKNFIIANALKKEIEKGNYKVFDGKEGHAPSLLRKYKIRLRGVDAPEIGQPYGEEAKVALRKLVKDQELLIRVYNTDCFGREVGDIHCNGVFIQEVLLKKGTVWHFTKHDKREAFAKWEREAKAARRGLWKDANPEAPWTYRYRNLGMFNNKRGRSFKKRGA